ncbi:MAG: hypothetical protein KY476_26885 [Planctomycetes bacterium]|nr:hypothetical protein [Planctomycetota bacterium]
MTEAAEGLLTAFDNVTPREQQQVAVEILRRSSASADLPEEAFDELAADVFRSYDAEEAGDGEG